VSFIIPFFSLRIPRVSGASSSSPLSLSERKSHVLSSSPTKMLFASLSHTTIRTQFLSRLILKESWFCQHSGGSFRLLLYAPRPYHPFALHCLSPCFTRSQTNSLPLKGTPSYVLDQNFHIATPNYSVYNSLPSSWKSWSLPLGLSPGRVFRKRRFQFHRAVAL